MKVPKLQRKKRQRLAQGDVDGDLMDAVDVTAKAMKLKKNEVIAWGLRAFLLNFNPQIARALDIYAEHQSRKAKK